MSPRLALTITPQKALTILRAVYRSARRALPHRPAPQQFRSAAVPGWIYLPLEDRVEPEKDTP